ncbi:MAG: hypothetical protein HRT89_13870 [Lentisphaeria bacterium]|nr:hypothetical protein [Lentisphaeria bacterium]
MLVLRKVKKRFKGSDWIDYWTIRRLKKVATTEDLLKRKSEYEKAMKEFEGKDSQVAKFLREQVALFNSLRESQNYKEQLKAKGMLQ